jgi:release factor glutamine methyltransferase
MPTIRAQVAAARRRLKAAGIQSDEADLDARLLAEHALGWTAERFLEDAGESPPPGFQARFDNLIARRASREPYAYIVGRQEFWGLQMLVTPDVLIPRPETELVVEAALEIVPAGSPATIADIGTGSGCLAIAVALERPAATIVATDISKAAVAVARQNAARHGVSNRVDVRRADLLEGVDAAFDLIVSNPPYVPDAEHGDIQPEVRFEPAAALYAGEDGLDAIRRLIADAPARLKPGGSLIFEFGFGQADAVVQLISRTARLTMVAVRDDLQDIPRVALTRRTLFG